MLVVEVGGAVARPGVYRLPAGSRVTDAIAAAGGFGARVDAGLADRQLNLAAAVRDGDEIHVPARGEQGTSGGQASGGRAGGTSVAGGTTPTAIDLNTATPEQLDTLPGVGPVTAAKIVAARQERSFSSVDDLGTRKVLGPAALDKIRALVTVGP
jgi:competence protein ComEA